MSSEYLLSSTAYQNWLLICETANKWHMCKSICMEVSGGLFSCEFCEISKNTFFTKHLRATASVKIEMQVKIMTSK